nr:hypothetical protein [Tanacetum cinerariifolium]
MSQDVITVGSTKRISSLYRGEYSQWRARFMNYLEEQTDGEAMINSIQNDKSMWTAEEKKNQKIDRLAISLLIQGISNDIYSLIDSNNFAKELWDALERHMLGSEYGKQERKAAVLYEYETFKATGGEMFLDTYIRYLQVINNLKKCGYKKDKFQSESEGSDDEDISDLKKITALLAKAFNRKKYYAKPTNKNLRTSSANKKPEYVKSEDKKVDEKKQDMSKVKCYNCKKEGHFAKDCKKAKDQAWMESNSDSDQEINANMVFMAKMEKVLSDSEESSSSSEETIAEVSYYTFDSERESEYETSEYYDNSTNYGLFVENDDDQQTSSLKPYVPTVILEKIIIDLEDDVHMTGNRALLTNFVEMFLGTVRFGNNDFAVITGYGDVVIRSMTIKKVY